MNNIGAAGGAGPGGGTGLTGPGGPGGPGGTGGGGVKLEVCWASGRPDHFITWGSDLSLYEVAPHKDIPSKPTSHF